MSQDFAASIFLTSVLGIVLVPTCYCFFKNIKSQSKGSSFVCIVIILIIASGFFYFLADLLAAEAQKQPFDPYEILNVPLTATEREIKLSFRELSKKYHPDKNPDENDRYLLITRAYATLTDSTAKANYEKYGNPDGPSGFRVILT